MPFKVKYEIYDGIRQAPVYSSYNKLLASMERDKLIKDGKGIYSMRANVITEELTKPEKYVYLVYEVRQLQHKYFNQGRDNTVLHQALDKEKELDAWNSRTSAFLSAHQNYVPTDARSHAFFLIVVRWRWLWKGYFSYKKKKDADPAIVREKKKECEDYEKQIDKYIKETIGL